MANSKLTVGPYEFNGSMVCSHVSGIVYRSCDGWYIIQRLNGAIPFYPTRKKLIRHLTNLRDWILLDMINAADPQPRRSDG